MPGGIPLEEPRNAFSSPPDYILVSRAKLGQLIKYLATREARAFYSLSNRSSLTTQVFDCEVDFSDDGVATVTVKDDLEMRVWTSSPTIGAAMKRSFSTDMLSSELRYRVRSVVRKCSELDCRHVGHQERNE
jgi:hypothetical protein